MHNIHHTLGIFVIEQCSNPISNGYKLLIFTKKIEEPLVRAQRLVDTKYNSII